VDAHRNARALSAAAAAVVTLCGTAQSVGASGPTSLWAWGYNFFGQLGVSGVSSSATPVQAGGLPASLVAIGGGQNHSLAVASGGSVSAWGDNFQGQLGNGTTTSGSTPVQVSNLSGASAVAGGNLHSLALRSDGTVWAWGWNIDGQLGNGTNTDSLVPVRASGLSGVSAIASGYNHSLALRSDGTVWAWGEGVCGEMGNGANTNSNVAIKVPSLSGVVAIAGGYETSFAVKSDGTAWTWGGTCNAIKPNTAVPLQVGGVSGATAVADTHILKNDGTVWSLWSTTSSQPAQIPGLSDVSAIASEGGHSMALKLDGTVWCWGQNQFGQLGNGTTTDSSTPVRAGGLGGVSLIAAGGAHSLAVVGTTVTPPSAPVGLVARPRSQIAGIDLSWQAPVSSGSSSVTAYRIYRGTASEAETFLIQVPATSLSYTDSNLSLTTLAYYYQVAAVNTQQGPRSNEACASPVAQALGCPGV
jgi:alpha-tubulin suppressor-like RCC1 family protein